MKRKYEISGIVQMAWAESIHVSETIKARDELEAKARFEYRNPNATHIGVKERTNP